MSARLAVGTPVEPVHAPQSGSTLRGVVVKSLTLGRVAVAWIGMAEWYSYDERELRPAEQDDRGCYALEVPLF